MGKKIFQWYGKGKSPVWIKRQLDGAIPTKRGKPIWSEGSVNSVLRNTHYIGYYDYKGVRIDCLPLVTKSNYAPVLKRHKENAKRQRVAPNLNQKNMITSCEIFCTVGIAREGWVSLIQNPKTDMLTGV